MVDTSCSVLSSGWLRLRRGLCFLSFLSECSDFAGRRWTEFMKEGITKRMSRRLGKGRGDGDGENFKGSY